MTFAASRRDRVSVAFCAEFTALPYARRTCERPKPVARRRLRDAARHIMTDMGRFCLRRATPTPSGIQHNASPSPAWLPRLDAVAAAFRGSSSVRLLGQDELELRARDVDPVTVGQLGRIADEPLAVHRG